MVTDPPATDRTARDGVRAVLVAIGVAVAAFVFGALLVALLTGVLVAIGVPVRSRPALRLAVGVVALQGIAFGGTALAYLRYRGRGLSFLRVRVPTLRDLGWVVGGFVALLGLLALSQVVLSALGIQSAQNQVVRLGNRNPTVFLLMVPLSFLLVGPGEELLFRGLVQGTLTEAFHPARAIVLASAIFAIVHYSSLAGSGKLAYLGVVFALALLLGAAYERTDNLVVPALIHGAYNAVQFGLAYLNATGGL